MVQNTYQVTWKRFREWGLENALQGVRFAMSIFWLLLAVCVAVLIAIGGGTTVAYVMLFFCIYRALFRWLVVSNAQYRNLCANHKGADWERVISFEEDMIHLHDGVVMAEYAYSDVESIKEKGNKIWLNMNNKTVVRLYKDCFTHGTWEMCKAMLTEKN
ncbi:MAG: YcxB family protein [Lachnospiraceae bacterium]|nr:YcxB family protein [Lachnospiraceae bacterium]